MRVKKSGVQEMIFNGILCYAVEYIEGTTVRFPWCAYGKGDAEAFFAMKMKLAEVEA
jgi:hypothetical protein